MFTKFGIRGVTMNDIANELGMSKKTLYQNVTNKAELVEKTLQVQLTRECTNIEVIHANSANAIEEMVSIGNSVYQHFKMMHPSVIYDLKKYYRKAWQLLDKHKQEVLASVMVRNIKNGIEQGLYRDNLNPELIVQFYLASTEVVIGDKMIGKQRSFPEIYMELLKYHIYGIASEKGIKYLKENIKNIKDEQYAKWL